MTNRRYIMRFIPTLTLYMKSGNVIVTKHVGEVKYKYTNTGITGITLIPYKYFGFITFRLSLVVQSVDLDQIEAMDLQ